MLFEELTILLPPIYSNFIFKSILSTDLHWARQASKVIILPNLILKGVMLDFHLSQTLTKRIRESEIILNDLDKTGCLLACTSGYLMINFVLITVQVC